MVLARDVPMADYREGDLVTIEGAILSEKSQRPLGGALCRANKIALVERGVNTN